MYEPCNVTQSSYENNIFAMDKMNDMDHSAHVSGNDKHLIIAVIMIILAP